MAYEITATKFRPQSFDKLVGQEFVSETLKNSIASGRIANAYLLSGPRGVGKTSTARIIAKALNCVHGPTATPCNECENCKAITVGNHTDVFEIDGASNTGVNEIKKIQEEIIYPPVNAKYKVYIIDEVHMLSKNAFNALLKTIEEPPKGVVFIFATTEINKVLPTIRSRCQLFNLRLIPTETIYNCLKSVLDSYNVKYDDNAIRWVAVEGKGSMRDSYTLLDQVISFCNNDITLEAIREKMGLVGEDNIRMLVDSIVKKDRAKLIGDYYNILSLGVAAEQLLSEMIKFFRNVMFKKVNVNLDSFEFSNAQNYVGLTEIFEFKDIENILEVLFKTFEKSRTSVDVKVEVESMLLKLINYDSFIRPQEIINKLEALKLAFENPNSNFSNQNQVKQTVNPTDSQNVNVLQNHEPKQNQNFSQVNMNNYQNNNVRVNNPNPVQNIQNQQNIQQNVNQTPNLGQQNVVQKTQEQVKVVPADKSDIVNLIKSRISPTNNLLLMSLDNIARVEVTVNVLKIYFTSSIYYDTAIKSKDLLTNIVKNAINSQFSIEIILDKSVTEKNSSDLNVENISKVFHAHEL